MTPSLCSTCVHVYTRVSLKTLQTNLRVSLVPQGVPWGPIWPDLVKCVCSISRVQAIFFKLHSCAPKHLMLARCMHIRWSSILQP